MSDDDLKQYEEDTAFVKELLEQLSDRKPRNEDKSESDRPNS